MICFQGISPHASDHADALRKSFIHVGLLRDPETGEYRRYSPCTKGSLDQESPGACFHVIDDMSEVEVATPPRDREGDERDTDSEHDSDDSSYDEFDDLARPLV